MNDRFGKMTNQVLFELSQEQQQRHCYGSLPQTQEGTLWRAVITQALLDASSTSKKRYVILNKKGALQWLSGITHGFMQVCDWADLHPEYVLTKSQMALQRGCKWRNDKKPAKPIIVSNKKG